MNVEFQELKLKHNRLLTNIKANLPELEKLLERISDHWVYEDLIYRFYHQSFKVYRIQGVTQEIIETLKSVSPDGQLHCEYFKEIIETGASGKEWKIEHNKDWTRHTRVFIEAFLHAKFFLEMAVKYGKELKESSSPLPSGWAALLYLYGLR